MERSDDKIYLSVVRDGDKFKVVDQDGRSVYGLRGITVTASYDDVTIATVTFLDAPVNSQDIAHIGLRDASKKQQPE